MLLVDTCSQRNFFENVFGDQLYDFNQTLYDALVVGITAGGHFLFRWRPLGTVCNRPYGRSARSPV